MASQIQSAQKWKFDVFFNFRQQDLYESFVADLHKRLKDIGINVFKPNVNSEWGEQISTEILEAIEESRIAVTIFSKDYTSSPRCLEELTKIMECVDNKGQEFFFVLYKVKPSDGLSPLGTFEADIKGFDLEKVQRWKDSLRVADDMAGSRDYLLELNFPIGDYSSMEQLSLIQFCETCSS